MAPVAHLGEIVRFRSLLASQVEGCELAIARASLWRSPHSP